MNEPRRYWRPKKERPLKWSEAFWLLAGGTAVIVLPFLVASSFAPVAATAPLSDCVSDQFQKNGFQVLSLRAPRASGSVVGYRSAVGEVSIRVVPDQGAHVSLTVASPAVLPSVNTLIGDVTRNCLLGDVRAQLLQARSSPS